MYAILLDQYHTYIAVHDCLLRPCYSSFLSFVGLTFFRLPLASPTFSLIFATFFFNDIFCFNVEKL